MTAHRRRSASRAVVASASALAMAIGAAACGDGSLPPEEPDPGGLDVDGRTFLSTEVDGYTLVPETRIVLTFEGENLGASAGCNALDGGFQFDDEVLVVDEIAQTEIGCDPTLAEQDRWLAALLTARPTLRQAGDTISISSGATTVRLTDQEVADPDRPLEATVWTVVTLNIGDAATPAPPGASIVFQSGTVEVDLGCNTGTGAYTLEGSMLTFGTLTATAKSCHDEGVMTLEATMSEILRGDMTFHITAGRLDLTGPTGGLQLTAN